MINLSTPHVLLYQLVNGNAAHVIIAHLPSVAKYFSYHRIPLLLRLSGDAQSVVQLLRHAKREDKHTPLSARPPSLLSN